MDNAEDGAGIRIRHCFERVDGSIFPAVDIKATAIGAIFGTTVCGVVWWLTERDPLAAPGAVPAAETAIPAQPAVRSQPDALPQAADKEAESAKSTAQEPESDSSRDDFETEISTSNAARARRWKEDRDLDWSYGTEQAIRQYLATDKAASKFEMVLVECRTSFCEIEASGYAADAWPSWQLVIQDVTSQPWSEFGSTGSSTESRDGRPMFIATFYRRQDKANSTP